MILLETRRGLAPVRSSFATPQHDAGTRLDLVHAAPPGEDRGRRPVRGSSTFPGRALSRSRYEAAQRPEPLHVHRGTRRARSTHTPADEARGAPRRAPSVPGGTRGMDGAAVSTRLRGRSRSTGPSIVILWACLPRLEAHLASRLGVPRNPRSRPRGSDRRHHPARKSASKRAWLIGRRHAGAWRPFETGSILDIGPLTGARPLSVMIYSIPPPPAPVRRTWPLPAAPAAARAARSRPPPRGVRSLVIVSAPSLAAIPLAEALRTSVSSSREDTSEDLGPDVR